MLPWFQSLSTIAELRDSVRFPYKGELDHAVGCAVKTMGPRTVLSAIPLQITGQRLDFLTYIDCTKKKFMVLA
jgi:hypothetical protein